MSLTSKREPVIALDNFRYRGRSYKEGSYLDRRRCGMPQSKLNRMLREKKVAMAQGLTSNQLKDYGWVYDPKSPRNKLQKYIEPVMEICEDNPTEEKFIKEKEFHISTRGNGWYDVMKGEDFIKKRVRKKTALKLLKDLKGGLDG